MLLVPKARARSSWLALVALICFSVDRHAIAKEDVHCHPAVPRTLRVATVIGF